MPRPNRALPTPNAMIVAPQPEAAHAGAEVLAGGGNAMDAALACAFVQGVVDPLMSGLGGFGICHVYDPQSASHRVFSALPRCPAAAREDMWADRTIGETSDGFGFIVKDFVNECGAAAVAPPPILDLFDKAHRRYGSLKWGEVVAPAVEVARKGWLLRPHVYAVFTQNERKYGRMNYGEKLAMSADGRRLYMEADGSIKRPGALIRNEDLAGTLELVASGGPDVLFTGSLGAEIVAEIERGGGLVTAQDLADCAADEDLPLDIDYRGFRVSTVGAPGGGLYLAQALRLLERFDLVDLGHNTPAYMALLAEAMKTASRDKDTRIADPEFGDVATDEILSDAYAEECARFIRDGGRVDALRSGHLESKHTTHVSCVDRDGMVVSMSHTLGNPSGVMVPGTGFMLNGAMASFDPRPGQPHSIAPGKRRMSSMCPSIVFDGAAPVMTLGAPGASWIGPAVLQVIVNVLDWGMGIEEAIIAPRLVATSNAIDISNRISARAEAELARMGYEVRRSHLSYAFAGVHGLTMWPEGLAGGADPQRDGMAVGVA